MSYILFLQYSSLNFLYTGKGLKALWSRKKGTTVFAGGKIDESNAVLAKTGI